MKLIVQSIFLFIALTIVTKLSALPHARQATLSFSSRDTTTHISDDSSQVKHETIYLLFPDFYSYWPVDKDDTILKYECFNKDNAEIDPDTLHNTSVIWQILLVKVHTDFLHSYIDSDGRPQPKPVVTPIFRYTRQNDLSNWECFDYSKRETFLFGSDMNNIVKTDSSLLTNPETGNTQMVVRKYYLTNLTPWNK